MLSASAGYPVKMLDSFRVFAYFLHTVQCLLNPMFWCPLPLFLYYVMTNSVHLVVSKHCSGILSSFKVNYLLSFSSMPFFCFNSLISVCWVLLSFIMWIDPGFKNLSVDPLDWFPYNSNVWFVTVYIQSLVPSSSHPCTQFFFKKNLCMKLRVNNSLAWCVYWANYGSFKT